MPLKSLIRSLFLTGAKAAFLICLLSFAIPPQDQGPHSGIWPVRYSASYGFGIMTDHNGLIIVSAVDSLSPAYRLGVRPEMELIGWNTVPVKEKLESMKVRKYRKIFPGMTDTNIRLLLLVRARPGYSAEVFFMTATGNNWGVRLKAK